ncbi:retroviral-like aspartic protease family protein [Gammaproteobacteria bacterium]|nr:retroviral-like aspartic protease family protein [Gammaproteobacteria bacterium]
MKCLRACIGMLMLVTAAVALAESANIKVIALFSNKALLQVGDQRKVVTAGETFEGVLLQSATGRGAVVVIDGETMNLGLNQSIAGNFKKPDRSKLRIVPDARGMYFVRGTINDKSTSFLVDTGATHVTLSGNKARALNIDFKKGSRGMAQTAAAIVPVWQIELNSVSIGGIKLSNVSATVIDGDKPSEVLLGNSFLRHTDMQQANSVLIIQERY